MISAKSWWSSEKSARNAPDIICMKNSDEIKSTEIAHFGKNGNDFLKNQQASHGRKNLVSPMPGVRKAKSAQWRSTGKGGWVADNLVAHAAVSGQAASIHAHGEWQQFVEVVKNDYA